MNNILKKLTGHRYGNRYSWGEFYLTLHPKNWDLSFQLYEGYNDSGNDTLCIKPLLFKMYVHMPTRFCQPDEKYMRGNGKSYGFYVYTSIMNFTTLVFQWGKWGKHIEMPWTYKWYSGEILDFDGKVVHYHSEKTRHIPFEKRFETEDYWKKQVSQQVNYTYQLKNGEIQKRTATIYPYRSTYTMRIFPWIKKIYNYVEYSFNSEVGEGTGSYKGGVMASSEQIKNGETAIEAFRRMERERKFN